MTRVVIIGGSGHVGTYLVPRLVAGGFEVISVSRGQRAPYQLHGAWKFVRTVTLDREAEENAGVFGKKIRELRPDIVIDMICFTEASARHLVDALRARCGISCILGRSGCTAHRPRSHFAAMPRRWRHGSGASRSCAICRGRNGRQAKTNRRPSRLTIISHTVLIAASPRRSACSTIGRAIGRLRPYVNR
jgi:NADPH:quinone reductase-like Zn-dependent oxidoreductase